MLRFRLRDDYKLGNTCADASPDTDTHQLLTPEDSLQPLINKTRLFFVLCNETGEL